MRPVGGEPDLDRSLGQQFADNRFGAPGAKVGGKVKGLAADLRPFESRGFDQPGQPAGNRVSRRIPGQKAETAVEPGDAAEKGAAGSAQGRTGQLQQAKSLKQKIVVRTGGRRQQQETRQSGRRLQGFEPGRSDDDRLQILCGQRGANLAGQGGAVVADPNGSAGGQLQP